MLSRLSEKKTPLGDIYTLFRYFPYPKKAEVLCIGLYFTECNANRKICEKENSNTSALYKKISQLHLYNVAGADYIFQPGLRYLG